MSQLFLHTTETPLTEFPLRSLHHGQPREEGEGHTESLGGYSDQAIGVLPLSGDDAGHRAGGNSDCNSLDLLQVQEVQVHSGGNID